MALALNTAGSDTPCRRCPNPAVTSMEFSMAWLDGVPAPTPDTKFFCATCKPSHAAVCSKCGRHDRLEQEGAHPPISLAQFMGAHIIHGMCCTVCKTLAIAPMTLGEKRKRSADWLAEGAKRSCV